MKSTLMGRAQSSDDAVASVFPGGGEMGVLCRAHDWSATPLGPVDGWSRSLRTTVSTLLNSRFPQFLWWGPELIQIYNDAYRPSLGESGRHPDALGMRGEDFWTDIWPIISPQIRSVMGEGASTWHQDQLVAIERNGRIEEVYWTYSYSPVRDDDGSIGGTLVVCQETTGHVIARRRLDVRLQLAALEPGGTPQVAAEQATRILTENSLDVSFALCCGRSAQPGDPPVVLATCERMLEARPDAWPLAAVMATGEPRVVDVRGMTGIAAAGPWREPTESAVVLPLLPPGENQAVGALVVGLSPRLPWDDRFREFLSSAATQMAAHLAVHEHRAERERRDRELEVERARLAYVFQQAPSFLAVVRGPEHVFELANDAYHRLVGRRDIIGRPVAEALPEVRGQGFVELLDRVLTTGEPYVGERVPVWLERTSGAGTEERSLDFVYMPLLDGEGTTAGVIVHGVDVTDHVHALGEVHRLLVESEGARSEADEANHAKSRFLANMSHEVRTPINAIMGYTELLNMQVSGPLNDGQKVHLDRIRTGSKHLLRLVDDMLDLSKVEAGSMDVVTAKEAVRSAITAALAMVVPQARERGVDIPSEAVCDPHTAYAGDPDRVRQILVNLLSNAVKFSREDTRIRVRCLRGAEAAAGAPASLERETVGIEVEDTGIGLAEDQLERIFQPFVQVDSAPTRKEGGTGLGLTISRRLARLMGGDVTVRSRKGEGSVFTLWLPEAPPED